MKTTMELTKEEVNEAIKAYIVARKGNIIPKEAMFEPITEMELDCGEYTGCKVIGYKIETNESLISPTPKTNTR